jgi:hypothetical protein
MIRTFENKFDTNYLRFLADKLELNSLKASAINITRKEKWKEYKSQVTKKTITLKKAIKIDFCGLASTTLLGTNMEEKAKDICAVYPEQSGEIIRLKTDISEKFRLLLTDETLDDLNQSGIYLQIRLCFPYLYADFPISLIRAEDSEIWNAKMDHEVVFSGNAPISSDEWRHSNLYDSQSGCLKEIARLCDKHRSFSRIEHYDMAINTLEARFAVIPVPVCVLMINDIAFSDAYIYAKVTDENHLAFNTPVNAISQFSSAKGRKAKKEDTGFVMLRQNFLYIWRHDLTLYADMATRFRENTPYGLLTILPPDEVNAQWQKKIERIIERRKSMHPTYNPEAPREKERIREWKENVIKKMELNTRKIQDKGIVIDPSQLHIKIGRKAGEYYVDINYQSVPMFCLRKQSSNVLLCALTHFAFAACTGQDPKMHRWYISRAQLKRQVIKEMGRKGRIKYPGVTKTNLFYSLFNALNKSQWTFNIPQANIRINDQHEIEKAKYTDRDKCERSCLDGLLP